MGGYDTVFTIGGCLAIQEAHTAEPAYFPLVARTLNNRG